MSDEQFTLEKQRVTERLGAVEVQLATLSTQLDGHSALVMELLKEHQRFIHGTNGAPGAAVRLDRLEPSAGARLTRERVAATAVIGLTIKALWELVRR